MGVDGLIVDADEESRNFGPLQMPASEQPRVSCVTNTKATHFRALDPLRGLAALWVFAFHYSFSDQFRESLPLLHELFKQGDAGVPMFFVISGYCLAASARSVIRAQESTGTFLMRRMRRIFPPFWCSIVVVAALPFIIEFISSLKTGTFIRPTAEGNINFGYLNYGVFDWLRVCTLTQVFWPVEEANNLQHKFTTINAVYWTLAIEVQFYLMVVLALLLPRKAFYLTLTIVTLLALAVPGSKAIILSGVFLPYWPMFAMGVCLHFVIERGFSLKSIVPHFTSFASACILTLIPVVYVLAVSRDCAPSWMLFSAGFTGWLFCLHSTERDLCFMFRYKIVHYIWLPVLLLGAMSYSIYLLHGRLQFLCHQILRQFIQPGSIAFDIVLILMTCAICWFFFRLCERPFMTSQKRQPQSKGTCDDLKAPPTVTHAPVDSSPAAN